MTDEVEIESVATFYVGPTESFARSHAHSEINHERFSFFYWNIITMFSNMTQTTIDILGLRRPDLPPYAGQN